MNVLDAMVLSAAGVTLVAYLCRLDMLMYAVPALLLRLVHRRADRARNGHKLAIVLLHGCLAAACIFAANAAWEAQAGPLEVFAVSGAALWIVVSFTSWRRSVPEQFLSAPVPLDETPHAWPPG